MRARDVMSKRLYTVSATTLFRQLWSIIFQRHINALPVVDSQKKLLGIITKEDILKLLYPDYEDLIEDFFSVTDFEKMEDRIHELGATKAKDVMCKRVIFIREDTPIMRALSRMITRSVNQLPVLSQSDRVVGMVTKGDIFNALFKKHLSEKVQKLGKKIMPLAEKKKGKK